MAMAFPEWVVRALTLGENHTPSWLSIFELDETLGLRLCLKCRVA